MNTDKVGDIAEVTKSERRLRFRMEAMNGLRIALLKLGMLSIASLRSEE